MSYYIHETVYLYHPKQKRSKTHWFTNFQMTLTIDLSRSSTKWHYLEVLTGIRLFKSKYFKFEHIKNRWYVKCIVFLNNFCKKNQINWYFYFSISYPSIFFTRCIQCDKRSDQAAVNAFNSWHLYVEKMM